MNLSLGKLKREFSYNILTLKTSLGIERKRVREVQFVTGANRKVMIGQRENSIPNHLQI